MIIISKIQRAILGHLNFIIKVKRPL